MFRDCTFGLLGCSVAPSDACNGKHNYIVNIKYLGGKASNCEHFVHDDMTTRLEAIN